MSIEYTKIYEYKMLVGDLMDFAVAEQAKKNYSGTSEPETNASLAYEYSITEDDAHWFREYLRQALSKICTKLQPLQKYLEEPYQVDELVATLRFRLSMLYKTQRLEDVIREAVGNFICYRWYLMKGRMDFAAPYKAMFDDNLDELRGISVLGIYGRSTAVRPYDMGFGAQMPAPYETADIVIRDIRWQSGETAFKDLMDPDKHHLPDRAQKTKRGKLPGVTVKGMDEIILQAGDRLPLPGRGDKGMVIPGNPTHEVVIRKGNESEIG